MQLGMHPSIGLQIRQTTYAGLSDTGISDTHQSEPVV